MVSTSSSLPFRPPVEVSVASRGALAADAALHCEVHLCLRLPPPAAPGGGHAEDQHTGPCSASSVPLHIYCAVPLVWCAGPSASVVEAPRGREV